MFVFEQDAIFQLMHMIVLVCHLVSKKSSMFFFGSNLND